MLITLKLIAPTLGSPLNYILNNTLAILTGISNTTLNLPPSKKLLPTLSLPNLSPALSSMFVYSLKHIDYP